MKLNPGVGYTSANLGEASGLTIDAGMDWTQRNIGRQFECSITGAKVGESYEYRLHVRKGLVEFDYYASNAEGIIDLDDLGGVSGKNRQNMFFYINKFNVFPEGSRTDGTEEKSEFISKNGYIKLTPGKNYFVFLYKTTPDWKDSNDLWEAKAPQLGVSGSNDDPNNFVRTQRNGGGFLQSYLRLSESATVDNVVVTNPIGVMAGLDTAALNDCVTFHAEELLVTDSNEQYPQGMQDWLSGSVPVFAKPSTNPFAQTIDGMIISGVGNDLAGDGFIGKLVGYPTNAVEYGYSGYAGNYLQNDVVKAWNVNERYGWASTPFVSGLFAPEEQLAIRIADYRPDQPPVVDFDGGIEIKADNVVSIKTVGEMSDAGTGFVTTDCYRQDIAFIKWDAALNRFKIYQIQYGVIHMRQNPLGSFKNKLLKTPEEEAKWDTGFDLCSDITGTFSGYTKDLNHAYYVPPAIDQLPYYAGDEAIGDYQSPKETL
jgi:hypothetical protein